MNEQISPAENPVPGTDKPTQDRRLIGVDPTTFDRVVQYLSKRPWEEVYMLLNSLSQSMEVKVNG